MRRIVQTVAVSIPILAGSLIWNTPSSLYRQYVPNAQTQAADLLSSFGLRVESVTVEGRKNSDPTDILDALGAVRGTPILDVSIPKAKQRVEALPWVKTAQVVRRLPSTFHIIIEEHIAFAVWQHKGKYSLVSREGSVIAEVVEATPDMTILVGADAPANASMLFEILANQPGLTHRVKAAVRFGSRRWDLMLDDIEGGIKVKLPESNMAKAWAELAAIDLKNDLLSRAVSEIDLRVAGRMAVKLQEGFAPRPQVKKSTPKPMDIHLEDRPTPKMEVRKGV